MMRYWERALLWNIATAMSGRVRFILWQLNRAEQNR
jgi:hypothetical protein